MQIAGLDSSGDWLFGRGSSDYLVDEAAIELNIKTRLMEWIGDCFFNLQAGIDWNNYIGSKNNLDSLAASLKSLILKSDGVVNVVSVGVSLDSNRNFSATYVINTVYAQDVQNTLNMNNNS